MVLLRTAVFAAKDLAFQFCVGIAYGNLHYGTLGLVSNDDSKIIPYELWIFASITGLDSWEMESQQCLKDGPGYLESNSAMHFTDVFMRNGEWADGTNWSASFAYSQFGSHVGNFTLK